MRFIHNWFSTNINFCKHFFHQKHWYTSTGITLSWKLVTNDHEANYPLFFRPRKVRVFPIYNLTVNNIAQHNMKNDQKMNWKEKPQARRLKLITRVLGHYSHIGSGPNG